MADDQRHHPLQLAGRMCGKMAAGKKRGTIKVVTGAGKTILALAIMERLQAQNNNLRVAIVVPTIVLQNQWYEEILRNSNLPPPDDRQIGRGGS